MRKTPGQQLKAAREELGKSLSDMGQLTRIKVQQLQGLEEDNYDSIPAPMYVRGFMKLYAQKLGLNHEPLVEMYERIRKGEPAVPEEGPLPPRPVIEEALPVGPDPLSAGDERNVSAQVSAPAEDSGPRFDWQGLKNRLPALPASLPSKPVWMGAAGLFCFLLLLFGLRSCGSSGEPVEETLAVDGIPAVEEPLLSPPEPVYFQLPSSYQ